MNPLRRDQELLAQIKMHQAELDALFAEMSEHWTWEDGVYRFYHHSYKVYYLQPVIQKAVKLFERIGAGAGTGSGLNPMFSVIVYEGIDGKFDYSVNKDWEKHTRPIVEAFFHARYFLEMICKYGKELDEAPSLLPSGWASVLYLFNIR